MFSQFGRIIDVVAMKTYRLRGQAWVVFTDTAAATNALRTMQGFPFFDKPIVSATTCSTLVTRPLAAELPCLACCTLVYAGIEHVGRQHTAGLTISPKPHEPVGGNNPLAKLLVVHTEQLAPDAVWMPRSG